VMDVEVTSLHTPKAMRPTRKPQRHTMGLFPCSITAAREAEAARDLSLHGNSHARGAAALADLMTMSATFRVLPLMGREAGSCRLERLRRASGEHLGCTTRPRRHLARVMQEPPNASYLWLWVSVFCKYWPRIFRNLSSRNVAK
jgi:hypothetical protein